MIRNACGDREWIDSGRGCRQYTRHGLPVGAGPRLALVLFASLAAASGCQPALTPTAAAPSAFNQSTPTLTILTPHNERIRSTFEIGYNRYRFMQKPQKPYVRIAWVSMGTPRCVEYVNQVFTLVRDDRPRQVPDVMFGGGLSEHTSLAEAGYCVPLKMDDRISDFPKHIAGQEIIDPQGRFFPTGLTSFGIVFNRKMCERRNVAPPATWTDLADPRFYGWIGAADPAASGTTLRCMTLILQQQGWKDGWGSILRILGNTRGLAERSTDVFAQVRSGIFLASFSVNSDGEEQAAMSGDDVRYLNPPKASALSPDLVCVLKCGKSPELAEDFVRFCLGEEGQELWGVPTEQRGGHGDTLYHYPVDPDVYRKFEGKLCVPDNPTQREFGLTLEPQVARQRAAVLLPMVAAACGEHHVLLQRTWGAVVKAGMPPEAVAELVAPIVDEETAARVCADYEKDPQGEAAATIRQWSAAFEAKYNKVLGMVGG